MRLSLAGLVRHAARGVEGGFLLLDEFLRHRRAGLRLALGVLEHQFDRLTQHLARGVEVLDGSFHGPLHVLPRLDRSRLGQRADPADLQRLTGAFPGAAAPGTTGRQDQ